MEEENIFASAPHEGETLEEVLTPNVDKELEEETPAESQSENVEEPDLTKNDTWKKMREEIESERQSKQALEARLAALEKGTSNESFEQPEYLTDMIGENPEVARKFKSYEDNLKEQIKQELIQDQLNAQKKEQEEKEHWMNWTKERLAEVESEFKVDFTKDQNTKNELSKIMIDYSPTDEQGNLDYKKGMKILTELKKVQLQEESQKTQIKKVVADATVSKETSTDDKKTFMTANDFRGRGWR